MGWIAAAAAVAGSLLSGKSPSASFKSLPSISPEQRSALKSLLQRLGHFQPTQYGGDFTADLSGGEQTSLAALEERSMALSQPSGNLQAGGDSLKKLLDFQGQTADTSDFFKSNVQDPLLDQFNREILPSISRNFGGNDFFSSERQNTEGLARQDLLKTLTSAKSSVALDAYNQSRNRALQAAGLLPQYEGVELARNQSLMDILKAQGLPREIEQSGLDKKYSEFTRQQTQIEELLKLLGLLSTTGTIDNIGVGQGGSQGLDAGSLYQIFSSL